MASDSEVDSRPLAAGAPFYEERDIVDELSPRVDAHGQGAIAEAIIARAREVGVPVHESRELVAALMQFDLDQRIPPALYVAVAEVLRWVYRMEHKLAPGRSDVQGRGPP